MHGYIIESLSVTNSGKWSRFLNEPVYKNRKDAVAVMKDSMKYALSPLRVRAKSLPKDTVFKFGVYRD